jgi:predicted phosphate transport protein (TIGR00153 family)
MLGIRLIPKTGRFFEQFARSAELDRQGATILLDMLESWTDLDRKARQLKDIEHAADENTHEIFGALNVTFVTPLDREDMSELASALDDVIDWTEEASRRLQLYRLSGPTPLAKRLARVLLDQTEQLVRAVPFIENTKNAERLEEATHEIHRLENEGDDLFAEALGKLYDEAGDIPGVIRATRWGDIYQVLETATDKAEHVAVVLNNIALKHR